MILNYKQRKGGDIKIEYNWLYDLDSGRLRKWLADNNLKVDHYLKSNDGNKEYLKLFNVFPDIDSSIVEGYFFSGKKYKGYYYSWKFNPKTGTHIYYKSTKKNGLKIEIFNPATLNPKKWVHCKVESYSPDFFTWCYSLGNGDTDTKDYYFYDVLKQKTYPNFLKALRNNSVKFIDSSNVYYAIRKVDSDSDTGDNIYCHNLDRSTVDDSLIYKSKSKNDFLQIEIESDPFFEYIYVTKADYSATKLLYRLDRKKNFKKIPGQMKNGRTCIIKFYRGNIYYMTNIESNGNSINKYNLKNKLSTTLIKDTEGKISDASFIKNKFFILSKDFIYNRALVYDSKGRLIKEVKIAAGDGIFDSFDNFDGESKIIFGFQNGVIPREEYQINIDTLEVEKCRSNPIKNIVLNDIVRTVIYYKSIDGVEIPMITYCKKNIKLDGTNPTIINGYGGFNYINEDIFNPFAVSFVLLGGVFAIACVRGGGENGKDWHAAGILDNFQNSIDDFNFGAKHLIKTGYCTPGLLASYGASNGANLVTMASFQNPELYNCVVAYSGLYDLERFNKLGNTFDHWSLEYGDPADTRNLKLIQDQSPLYNANLGKAKGTDVSTPNYLIIAGENDDRVTPYNSYRLYNELAKQAKVTMQNPILLLRTIKDGAHTLTGGQYYDLLAEVNAFIFKSMGLEAELLNSLRKPRT